MLTSTSLIGILLFIIIGVALLPKVVDLIHSHPDWDWGLINIIVMVVPAIIVGLLFWWAFREGKKDVK